MRKACWPRCPLHNHEARLGLELGYKRTVIHPSSTKPNFSAKTPSHYCSNVALLSFPECGKNFENNWTDKYCGRGNNAAHQVYLEEQVLVYTFVSQNRWSKYNQKLQRKNLCSRSTRKLQVSKAYNIYKVNTWKRWMKRRHNFNFWHQKMSTFLFFQTSCVIYWSEVD